MVIQLGNHISHKAYVNVNRLPLDVNYNLFINK